MTVMPEVTAYLHGGPRDGETLTLPSARYHISLPQWDTLLSGSPASDVYRLRGPWRGQETAHYDFVEPEAQEAAA